MTRRLVPAAVAALVAAAALPLTARTYRTGPPAGHTGGFGEPTCVACHWSEKGEAGDARGLTVRVPGSYEPGKSYELAVTLEDPALRAAGFQLSARFEAGPEAGRMAGSLAPADSTVQVVTSGAGVTYASHTAAGTLPRGAGRAEWIVRWTAPDAPGTVVFHAAGNAANDDASEFGDRVHAATVRSAGVPTPGSRAPGLRH